MNQIFNNNENISGLYIGDLEAEKVYVGDTLVYENSPTPIPNYLNFTARNGNAVIGMSGSATPNVSYSFDGTNWTTWNYSNITLSEDATIYFKGNNTNGFSTSSNTYANFSISGNSTVEASGNVMSLLYGDDFEGELEIPSIFCFYRLFYGCTGLTTAPELPATTLTMRCYDSCFYGCTGLTSAPELPATTLADRCYRYMFVNCSSLTSAPELPATTLANTCYSRMFGGCTSLTTAPVLSSTTLASYCYQEMFNGCTSLTTAPELPATTLEKSCYERMFYGCRSLTTAPELPATTLADKCYGSMFQGCTRLNYIKAMFTTTPSTAYTQNWVSSVASSGTFVKNSAAEWDVSGNSGVPTGWTIQTASS